MVESYRTIQAPAEGLYKEKSSKFLSFAFPICSEDEVKERLAIIRKKYFDARHHCYAYTFGPDKRKYRANDDGEPNHSAGDPILGQIRSNELTDILIVVVRYFGGVKLGVGGLIGAYKAAAAAALSNSIIIEKQVTEQFSIRYEYKDTSEVMKLLNELDAAIVHQSFEQECEVTFEVKIASADTVSRRIQLMQDLGVNVKVERQSEN